MWQANGRSDVEFNYRCKLDDYYYHNWSIWLDFTIIYKTIKGVVYGKGIVIEVVNVYFLIHIYLL